MKVYLAFANGYDDRRVERVFARRADAEAYGLADEVEEFEVLEGPVEVREWHTLHWVAGCPDRAQPEGGRAANPVLTSDRWAVDERPSGVTIDWKKHPKAAVVIATGEVLTEVTHTLTVEGWDLERVRAVYAEQRADYEARYGAKPTL
jgi:hypothetical protein